MPITKIDMVKMLGNQLNIPQKECIDIVESVLEIIKSELEQNNPVKISGFGKWTVLSKKERKGRNPKTGEELLIKPRKVVTFKASKKLFGVMNEE